MNDGQEPKDEETEYRYPEDGKLHPTVSDVLGQVYEALIPVLLSLCYWAASFYILGLVGASYIFDPAELPGYFNLPDRETVIFRVSLAILILGSSWYLERRYYPR